MDGDLKETSPGEPSTLTISIVLSVFFLVVTIIGITIIHEIIGGRGFPTTPLWWGLILIPIMMLVCVIEPRIQRKSWWPKFENWWYGIICFLGCVAPLVLTVINPRATGTGLPRGIPSAIAIGGVVVVVFPFIFRAWLKNKRQGGNSDAYSAGKSE